MKGTPTKIVRWTHFVKMVLVILLVFLVLFLNDLYVLNKIENDRNQRIIELEKKMMNFQSRINANSALIDSQGNWATVR